MVFTGPDREVLLKCLVPGKNLGKVLPLKWEDLGLDLGWQEGDLLR